MAFPNSSDIAATTIEARSKDLADNTTKNIPLLSKLNSKGNVKPFAGGSMILESLHYPGNSTYTRYSGYDTLNTNKSDVITAANFAIKQAAVSVAFSGLDEIQNAGPEQVIDLLEGRIENAEASLKNGIEADLFSDGTADGGRQIGGLQFLIPDNPATGTVGGINAATWTFWQSQKFAGTVDGLAAVSTANINKYMSDLYRRCYRNGDAPDYIIADNNYYSLYEQSLDPKQYIVMKDTKTGDGSFPSLSFKGVEVILGGGYLGACPANHMYFINSKYLKFRPSSKRNMTRLDSRNSFNQDASIEYIVFAGNLTASNRFAHGVLIA